MAVTLKDVAREAGVSLATASLALNNIDKVNEETCRKVHKIAKKLNYIPNARARALVKRATRAVGLVIPEVVNPFFAELAQAIKNRLQLDGYNVILCSTDYKTEEEVRYINMFKSGMVDGAIFACLGEMMKKNSKMVTELARHYLPVVYVDRDGVDNDLIPVVKSNLKNGSYQATRHLIKLGHREIGFVGQSHERMSGYKQAMKEANLKVRQKYVYYNYLTIEGGFEVGNKLASLKKSGEIEFPTAIVCFNDEMAIGVIQALINNGISVPGDLSICGTDNIKITSFYNPPLTTVDVPKVQMGTKAAELILKLINGQELNADEHYIIYPTKLIVRKSTTTPL